MKHLLIYGAMFFAASTASLHVVNAMSKKPPAPVVVEQPKATPTPVPVQTPAVTPMPSPSPTPTPVTSTGDGINVVKSIAAGSACAKYNWKDRGRAPSAYIKGIALVYAKAVCNKNSDANKLISAARKQPESKYDTTDVLSWYNSNFKALGMNNDKDGIDTLRHVYTLLIGLGMRESSGKYCCGRDMSADFNTADTAEAGMYQSSWGAKRVSPEMVKLFQKYQASKDGCFLDVFKEGVSCSSGDAKNWGTGDGLAFQVLSKSCPAFSAEYAAILVRFSGGTKGEYGPLRKKAVEIRPECDSMLQQVEAAISARPEICNDLK